MKRALVLVAALFVLGACGGDDTKPKASTVSGKVVFDEAGCGNCHTFADAGATGVSGPDLDQLRPSPETVKAQVLEGGAGMPSFADRLSPEEIDAVSDYVGSAGGGSDQVGSAFEPDDTKLAECNGRSDLPCYEQAFGNAVYEQGPKPALEDLARAMQRDEAVALGCHRIAHRMGGAALARTENDVGLAFTEGTAVCSSGYYHGILEQAFAGVDEAELSAKTRELCTSRSIADDTFLKFQCSHGLGHGLMIHTKYELPLSLDTCDSLGEDLDIYSCQNGAFMENFTSSYGVVSGYLKEDDLLYPCNDVIEKRKPACYIIVTAYVLPELRWNWKKTAKVCQGAERDWVFMCFRSYGRDAISTNAYNQDVARSLCRYARDYESECVLSVAEHIVNEEGGLEGGTRFCRETPQSLREACFAGIGLTARLLIPDLQELSRACERITRTPQERFACVSGRPVGA